MKRRRIDWLSVSVFTRLGMVPDAALADELGVTRQAVALARKRMSIQPCFEPYVPPAEMVELMGTTTDVEIAKRFGVQAQVVSSLRRKRGVPVFELIGPVAVRHGTRSGYMNARCRCEACTAANRASCYAWNEANPDKLAIIKERCRAKALESAPHRRGTVAKYALGCRCDRCRHAARQYNKRRYNEKRQGAMTSSTASSTVFTLDVTPM